MKQSERKKVQSILENIRKQHNILESLPEKEVFALLEENQGTIIELGNYVEQNMGQTAPFIRMLEEYCISDVSEHEKKQQTSGSSGK